MPQRLQPSPPNSYGHDNSIGQHPRPDPAATPSFARHAQNALIALLLIAYVVLGWRARPAFNSTNDETVYLALSQSLERGSYREIFQPSAPRHVQYPPGYPAWLVVVRHTLGEGVELIPAVNLTLVASSLLVLTAVARSMTGGWLAVGLLLVLVCNPSLLIAGGSSLSEPLFLLLSIGSLATALGAERGRDRLVYAAIVLALLAFLTRAVGATLVVAIGVWLVSRRRRRELAVYAAMAAVVVGGWFAYATLTPMPVNVNSYANDFVSGRPSERPSGVTPFARRIRNNATVYATQILPAQLSLPSIPRQRADNAVWLLLTVLFMGTAVVVLWRTWRATAVFLALYAGLLLVWAWPIDRFLWSVLPLTMFAFVFGASWITKRLPDRVGAVCIAVLIALLTVGAAPSAAARVRQLEACDRNRPRQSAGCYYEDTRAVFAAAEYVRDHASANDAVLAVAAATVHFVSGHLTESATLVRRVPAAQLAPALRERGIRYVLVTSSRPFERGVVTRALSEACAAFRVEAHFPARTLLLSTFAPNDTTGNACADLADFRRANEREFGIEP